MLKFYGAGVAFQIGTEAGADSDSDSGLVEEIGHEASEGDGTQGGESPDNSDATPSVQETKSRMAGKSHWGKRGTCLLCS